MLYCVRFVFSLYSDQVVEVKPRSLMEMDLFSSVGAQLRDELFLHAAEGFTRGIIARGGGGSQLSNAVYTIMKGLEISFWEL